MNYRNKHTWKNSFPCIAFKTLRCSVGAAFCLFIISVLCSFADTRMALALEENTPENVEQSSGVHGTKGVQEKQAEQKSSVTSETQESLVQKESISTIGKTESTENSADNTQTENTAVSEQEPQKAQASGSAVSEDLVKQENDDIFFQKNVVNNKQNTLRDNNVYNQVQDSFTWTAYFQAIGIMLFLLLVLWYVLKLVRKFGNGRFLPSQKLLPRESLYLEGQLPLGPGKSVVVANILGQRLILGVTEKNITLLTKMVDNEDLEFAQIFQEKLQKTE